SERADVLSRNGCVWSSLLYTPEHRSTSVEVLVRSTDVSDDVRQRDIETLCELTSSKLQHTATKDLHEVSITTSHPDVSWVWKWSTAGEGSVRWSLGSVAVRASTSRCISSAGVDRLWWHQESQH